MKQQRCQNCTFWDGRQFRIRIHTVLSQKNNSPTLTGPIPKLAASARCKELEQVVELVSEWRDEDLDLPEIETPWYFGCNQWEQMPAGAQKPPKSERNIRSRW
jgi:hypothetical protein